MFSLDNLLASIAVFMLDPAGQALAPHVLHAPEPMHLAPEAVPLSGGMMAPCWADPHGLGTAYQPETSRQMRIERRVIVRVAPFPMPRRGPGMFDELPSAANPPRFEERRVIKCVPIRDISGVRQASNNRLVLFLHKDGPVSARLEKNCSARDFYSGFYIENSEDGMLCTGRDTLHSRAGANCSLSRLHRLAPIEE